MSEILHIRPSLLHQLRDHFRVDAVIVSVKLRHGNLAQHFILSKHSESVEKIENPRKPGSVTTHIIENAEVFRVASINSTPRNLTCSFMKAENLEAALGVPVYVGEESVGSILVMASKARIWSEDEVAKLQAYAELASRLSTLELRHESRFANETASSATRKASPLGLG